MLDSLMASHQIDSVVREALTPLREALLNLHKALLDSERVVYERSAGAIPSATAFLHLVTTDPWFAWLHPLSQLIATLDETLDGDEPLTKEIGQSFVDEAKNLLQAGEYGNEFFTFYNEAMQRDPDVIMAHAEVTRNLKPFSAIQ